MEQVPGGCGDTDPEASAQHTCAVMCSDADLGLHEHSKHTRPTLHAACVRARLHAVRACQGVG
jgi:hypothetical protein